MFTHELVDKYAKDLLIELSSDENQMVLEEFEIIEENMEKINRLADIKSEVPMTHAIEIEDVVLRSDEVKEELKVEEVLGNTKNKTVESIVVPKVVE